MRGLSLLLALGGCTASTGTVYRPTLGPLPYALTKTAISGAAYAVGREVGMRRVPAALVAIVAPWAAGKAVALLQGHRVPWQDGLGDLGFHALLVIPLATHSWAGTLVTAGVIVATCKQSSPRWC